MKIATVSHSHVHMRQHLFFKEVARQGHEVLIVGPGTWGKQRSEAWKDVNCSFVTARHMGGENIYDYHLLGVDDIMREFDPDWLYVQAEPGSRTANDALEWQAKKRALFTWENNKLVSPLVLKDYNAVIAGNPDAVALVQPYHADAELLLQVGVDVDHFQARPGVERNIEVAYAGRPVPEKGLAYLQRAWPITRILPYTEYRQMPWRLSEVQIMVAFSQDIATWREQAPNYVVLESLLCGCKAVVSDTAAMKFWLDGCPGVTVVEGHVQNSAFLNPKKIQALYRGITKTMNMKFAGDEARNWVAERFGNVAVAKRLIEIFEKRS